METEEEETEAVLRRAMPHGQRDERDASATMAAAAAAAELAEREEEGSEEDNGVLLRPPFGLGEEKIFVRGFGLGKQLSQKYLSSTLCTHTGFFFSFLFRLYTLIASL